MRQAMELIAGGGRRGEQTKRKAKIKKADKMKSVFEGNVCAGWGKTG